MTFSEIKELIKIFDESNLTKLSLKEDNYKIELDKNPSVSVTPEIITQQTTPQTIQTTTTTDNTNKQQTQSNENFEYIKSPMVGTFYKAPAPGKPPFVKVGDKVKSGDIVCIVEAMKIMNEIEATFQCEIVEVLVEDGQAVEYDTPLFKVKKV